MSGPAKTGPGAARCSATGRPRSGIPGRMIPGGLVGLLAASGCSGDSSPPPASTPITVPASCFGEDEPGNVYVVNYANGDLLKITVP